jgi:hypothetical protein
LLNNFDQLVYLIVVTIFFFKVLTNQLYPILDQLIGPHQLAFLKCRYILDAVVRALGVLYHVKVHREQGIILKLDFEREFNNADWGYILETFCQRGFDP